MNDRRVVPRWLAISIPVWLIFLLTGLAGLDAPLASLTERGTDPLGKAVLVLDHVSLKIFWDGLLPLLLVAVGSLALSFTWGRAMLFVGAVQGVTVAICDGAKPVFGRLRPFERIAAGEGDQWFAGGHSFLSGHTGFYAGIVFPIILLWPRSWLILFLPLVVALQRVLSHNHYLSDVAGSLLVASMVAAVATRIRPWVAAGSTRSR